MSRSDVYAPAREVTDPLDCTFYHTMEVPGLGRVEGEWDLTGCVDSYLGGVQVQGRRVLEIGSASGFLCFEMESRGAEVVAFDLSEDFAGDLVPFARINDSSHAQASRAGTRRFNNAYWLTHAARRSRAKVVHGSVYSIPDGIGPVDIVTIGAVLEHLRDPFGALAEAARFAKQSVIVTGVMSRRYLPLLWLSRLGLAWAIFLPRHERTDAFLSWWLLSPATVRRALGVLGFEDATITYHHALYLGRKARLFTIVANRTAGEALKDVPSTAPAALTATG
ncbi:MAG TPA: methyltransferase domain-containing protein [Longimicrobiales bacterium]|nr:methyltransferase domain-containing protein [Longimicrobiales bacterium]